MQINLLSTYLNYPHVKKKKKSDQIFFFLSVFALVVLCFLIFLWAATKDKQNNGISNILNTSKNKKVKYASQVPVDYK